MHAVLNKVLAKVKETEPMGKRTMAEIESPSSVR